MLGEIDAVLRQAGGVAGRAQLLAAVTRHQLDGEVRRGHLVARFPSAYCRPWDAEHLSCQAALVSAGPGAVLSHLSALRRWQLLEPASGPTEIHLTVPARRCPRSRPGLRIHRASAAPPSGRYGRLELVTPAEAIVTSWPLLPPADRRGPAIAAVRQQITKPGLILARLEAHPRVAARGELAQLVRLLEAGCESELEIWGLLGVFDIPGLRHGKRQLIVRTPAGAFRVDLGFKEERVAFELDGYRYHGGRTQRERDMRRDAALASIDWLTVRFSWERMHGDVAGCRRDALAILAARRGR